MHKKPPGQERPGGEFFCFLALSLFALSRGIVMRELHAENSPPLRGGA
jgi:hypothetical protein